MLERPKWWIYQIICFNITAQFSSRKIMCDPNVRIYGLPNGQLTVEKMLNLFTLTFVRPLINWHMRNILHKLHIYWITGQILKWVKDFLGLKETACDHKRLEIKIPSRIPQSNVGPWVNPNPDLYQWPPWSNDRLYERFCRWWKNLQ